MPKAPLPSIIIPAHNESAVIGNLLTSLYPGVMQGKYQVVVACNGCTDGTATLVRRHFPWADCEAISVASKSQAINHAETLSLGFPRIYVDADIDISMSSILALIDMCQATTRPMLVIPQNETCLKFSSNWIKLYYAAWKKTRYCRQLGFGSGVYALNEAARKRFGMFPKIISDDGFVRSMLSAWNVTVCQDAKSHVKAPEDLSTLFRVKVRSKLGNLQLKHLGLSGGKPMNDYRNYPTFVERPSLTERGTYMTVNLAAAFAAKLRFLSNKNYVWQRDTASRSRQQAQAHTILPFSDGSWQPDVLEPDQAAVSALGVERSKREAEKSEA